jgi:hypothetical protein
MILFPISTIPPAVLDPGVYSDSTGNGYQKQKIFLRNRARRVRKADSHNAICEQIVLTMWYPHNPHNLIRLHGLLRG